MKPLLHDIRRNPLLWLLVFVPAVLAAERLAEGAPTLLFVLSVLAIVPLAALLSHATESVAAKTGDAVGGLLSATLGNLTELIIGLAALRAGEYTLVKASLAGAIVANTLFVLGGSFLLGGLRHHTQEFNRANARVQGGLLFLATVALHDAVGGRAGRRPGEGRVHAAVERGAVGPAHRALRAGPGVLAQDPPRDLRERRARGRRRGALADWPGPWHACRRDGAGGAGQRGVRRVGTGGRAGVRHDARVRGLHRGGAGGRRSRDGRRVLRARARTGSTSAWASRLGSASQIALFVAPVLVLLSYVLGPAPMDLSFWPGAVVMVLVATMTAAQATNGGRSAWFVGVLMLMVYAVFAMTLYLLPPRVA